MLLALVDDQKVEAFQKGKGICPHCGAIVISKCGEFNIWHWAHKSKKECDTWSEGETAWHKGWKEHFNKDNCEVKIVKESEYHIADVLTPKGTVIEFQNSPMNLETRLIREEFYGKKMIWVLNGENFRQNLNISSQYNFSGWLNRISNETWGDFEYYKRNLPIPYTLTKVAYINRMFVDHEMFKSALSKNGFEYMDEQKIYLYTMKDEEKWLDVEFNIYNDLIKLDKEFEFKKNRDLLEWKYANKTWREQTRNVFIDMNNETLVWIKTPVEYGRCEVQVLTKKKFIEHYTD